VTETVTISKEYLAQLESSQLKRKRELQGTRRLLALMWYSQAPDPHNADLWRHAGNTIEKWRKQ
jgi:hypothetical protein